MLVTDPRSERNPALDFTKGFLVLLMIFYHCLNYFQTAYSEFYRYLRFITPSFIFITGFLTSSVYLSKYEIGDPRLHRRLVQRGLKLLVLFTALNVAALLALSGGAQNALSNVSDFFSHAFAIYVSGQRPPGGFWILVPISYALILSSVLLLPCKRYPWFLHVVCAFLLLAIAVLDFKGVSSPTLDLLTIGLLGMVCGRIPPVRLHTLATRIYLIALAFLLHFVAISFVGAIYPLQVVGVCLALLLMYGLGLKTGSLAWIPSRIILLGKYSLFAYVLQIAFLQVLRRFIGPDFGELASLALALAATTIVTYTTIEILARLREHYKGVDWLYRGAFA